MESQNLKQRTIKGIITQIFVNFILKGLTVIKTFIFARIFVPEDFGIFATAVLVISFITLFGELGISQSIIKEKGDARKLMDTAFTMNILVGFLFLIMIFLSAPIAANIFGNPDLTLYILFLSYSAFGAALELPNVMFDREMRFGISKLPQFFLLVATFVVTIIAVKLYHMGTWSLFLGALAGFIANVFAIWVFAPYKPKVRFDKADAVQLFSFGWPLLINSILAYIVLQGDDLLVRYFWGDEMLGYYTIAFYMPMYLIQIVNMISAVLLPAFSKIQDSKEKLEYAFAISNKYLAIICVPIGIGMAVFAPQIIHYFYSDKWAPAIPVLQIFALSFMISTSTGYNWGTLAVIKGKTKYFVFNNLIIVLGFISVGYWLIRDYGMMGGAVYNLFTTFITAIIIRIFVIKKFIGNFNYLKSIYPVILSGCLSGVLIYYVFNEIYFILNVSLFILFYIIILLLMDRKLILEVRGILMQFKNKDINSVSIISKK
ncbi:MAG: oligosaccharide flippase family protein [Candidatus Methanoperedens sp.]|nr:oligosaccharide flippase family protein [Candidatus Methanoperedens sp.]